MTAAGALLKEEPYQHKVVVAFDSHNIFITSFENLFNFTLSWIVDLKYSASVFSVVREPLLFALLRLAVPLRLALQETDHLPRHGPVVRFRRVVPQAGAPGCVFPSYSRGCSPKNPALHCSSLEPRSTPLFLAYVPSQWF
jgi:hypothetical protein